MSFEIVSWKTHATSKTVLDRLFVTDSTYSTVFAMKNLFDLTIVPKFTNWAIVFRKLNLTVDTLVGL